jgi:hypothetical protein
MVSEGDRDSGGLELVIVRVRTSVWAVKKDVPQAWHEPATKYINTELVAMKTKSSSRGIMAFESMAFWLN